MKLWGIDPGLNGALVLLDTSVQELSVFPMPTLATKKNKREVMPFMIADILLKDTQAPVVLEQVSARPGQGTVSMFNFGKSYGMVFGVVAGLQMRISTVTPQQWKKDLKVQKGKDAARARAMELYPHYSDQFVLKKDDGKAEAALIATWGSSFGQGDI